MTLSEFARLTRVIEDEAVLLKNFVALLEHEESVLVDGQTDALFALAEEKTQVYRRLQFLHDERCRVLGRNGQGSLRAALAATPAAALWTEVLSLAAEAQRRNTLNGQIIAERMKHNQAALSVLLAAADQPQLYGPDGQSRPAARGRPLGSV